MISDLLQNKTSKEKAQIKAKEIANLKIKSIFDEQKYGVKLEIISVDEIEGGIQIFARAWKDGKQLGFGKDGTVDIERFRIYNPPVLVPDGTKRTVASEHGKVSEVDNFIESPQQAVILSLSHVISIVGKTETRIQNGKIGNTTSTFYPAAGANSPVDGRARKEDSNDWATTRNAATGQNASATETQGNMTYNYLYLGTYGIFRSFFLFNTAAIGTDTIDSSTFSVYGYDKGSGGSVHVVSSSPASDADITTADYDQIGGTSFATMNVTSWSLTGYNDFALNASGLANITGSGISKFGMRGNPDYADSAPAGISENDVYRYYADQTGTTNDPKLVVVHTSSATSNSNFLMVM